MNYKKVIFVSLALLVAVTSFGQTNARPPKKKQSALNKVHENITAKYNGYFNAKLKLNEGITKLSDQYEENYTKILPLYKYAEGEDVQLVVQDLDVAILKAAVDIKLQPKSNFVDDCYLLIGQSQYLKKDFESAENTFTYIIEEFDPLNLKKKMSKEEKAKARKEASKDLQKERADARKEKEKERKQTTKDKNKAREDAKKQREKDAKAAKKAREKERKAINEARNNPKPKTATDPVEKIETPTTPTPTKELTEEEAEEAKNYFLKHRPIREDAMVWLARTYAAQGKYDDAIVWINRLKKRTDLVKDVEAELAVVSAYYFLKQKDYDNAIVPLQNALETIKDRQLKIRIAFIIAQIHEQSGRKEQAIAAYEKVLKLKPIYDMEFSSKLNIAKNSWGEETNSEEAEKALAKMLKDDKNLEYRDQIYYTLGKLALNEKKTNKAINYLKKSLNYSVNNKTQKGESYISLARLYFETEDYIHAKDYYDSTKMVMNKKDERYEEVEQYSSSLTDIASNLRTIVLQDSLLAIQKLIDSGDEDVYMAMAQRLLDERRAAKEAKVNPNNPLRGNGTTFSNPRPGNPRNGQNVATFWAYDANELKRGKRDFTRKWGTERKLADNWRRSNRKDGNGNVEEIEEVEQEFFDMTAEEAIEFFAKSGVPQSEEEAKEAHNQIIEAMSALGTLFRNRLNNTDKAIEILEQLMSRYPDNKYKLESMYALFLMYHETGNTPLANKYKARILEEGKGTKFARAILNPKFIENEKEKEKEINLYYDQAYTLFENRKFKEARNKVDQLETKFGKEVKMRAKFDLLAAMCTGGIDGIEPYKLALQDIISKYPETEEQKKAKDILAIIGKDKTKEATASKVKTARPTEYTVNKTASHFVVIEFSEKQVKQRDAKTLVTDYNRKFNKLERYRVNNFLFDLETPVLIVRRFSNAKTATKYMEQIKNAPNDLFGGKKIDYQVSIIDQDNYRILLGERSTKGKQAWLDYKAFFLKNYSEE